MTWTKCEDELPEPGTECLVCQSWRYCPNVAFVAFVNHLGPYWIDAVTEQQMKTQPTHWMPVPEPPK